MNMILSVIKKFFDSFPNTYTSDLERYIIKNKPQNTADVEKLMFEYYLRKGNALYE